MSAIPGESPARVAVRSPSVSRAAPALRSPRRELSGARRRAYLRGMEENTTCREVREGLTEYLDGALPPDERQGFERHLAHCDRCRTRLEELGLTLARLSSLPREPMPPAMKRTLLDAFRDRSG